MKRLTKASLRSAINLFLFSIAGTTVLILTFNLTHELIAQSENEAKLKLINQAVPAARYDNDLLKDSISLAPSENLGTEQDTIAYRGRLNGQPSIVVLEAIAPDGYGGKINMIVAFNYAGSISGVRVVSHKETPGLGDYIDITKNAWINLFGGASHQRPPEAEWKVKKDGGQFDYMAGATITPRAVVKAVHKSLHYFEENRDRLFAENPGENSASNTGKEAGTP